MAPSGLKAYRVPLVWVGNTFCMLRIWSLDSVSNGYAAHFWPARRAGQSVCTIDDVIRLRAAWETSLFLLVVSSYARCLSMLAHAAPLQGLHHFALHAGCKAAKGLGR